MSETTPPHDAADEPGAADIADKTSPAAPKRRHHAAKHSNGRGIFHTLLMLVALAGVGAGGYYLWHMLLATQQQQSADSASAQQQLGDLRLRTEQLEQKIAALPASLAALQAEQQALGKSVDKLRDETVGDAHAWVLEEIGVLLQIANDRLQLEGDVAPGLAALEAADRHLQALKNPALLEVRRLLAEEIAALRAVAAPDRSGMALSLGALVEGIDRLPIAGGETAGEQTAAPAGADRGWRGVLNDIWERLKGLVVIKHRGDADRALLAPDERYFLKQNLRLELETARIALLRRDSHSYQQTLRSAQEWITLYFNNEAPAVASTLKELARLQQIDIAPTLPDISASLNALQSRLAQRQRQNSKAVVPEAAP